MDHKKILAFAVLFLLSLSLATAQQDKPDHIIANSNDWRDVYSTMLYGNLINAPTDFLTSTRHSTLILFQIPNERDHLQVITDQDNRYVVGYEDILLSRGYDEAEELIYSNVNLELASQLEDTHRFIVMDDSYGYNAISAAPYAVQAGYYVLFADELNIDQVTSFLQDHGVDDLIIFGQVDRAVRQNLQQFNPEIVNEGDRFDNNLAMVDKYLAVKETGQAILTNGEFIESSIMGGQDPIIFIGRANVPDQVREYIQESDIEVGILIGNELIGAATFIRRQIGISVFVKFAQGSRSPTGPIAQVEDLDRFPMPRYTLNMTVESIRYNRATEQLEVTYSNNVDLATYFKSTITINNPDGTTSTTGDEESVFIDGGDLKTITYDVDVPSTGGNASLFTIYGEAPDSLENELEATLPIDFVEVRDASAVNITNLVYDSNENQFLVKVKNVGDVRAYADVEIVDLMINEQATTVGADEIVELQTGETMEVPVSAELSEADIQDNQEIDVRANYGERELALIKEARAKFDFKEKAVDYTYYALIAAIVILLFLIWRKKKDEEEEE